MNSIVHPVSDHQQTPATGFALEQTNYINTLVEGYQKDLLHIDAAIAVIEAIPKHIRDLFNSCSSNLTAATAEDMKALLLAQHWFWVYRRSNISYFLDSHKKKEWEGKLYPEVANGKQLPPFTFENVRSTLQEWYAERESMFMDRVDSIFTRLSHKHVTNEPQGFSKKMIFSAACQPTYSGSKNYELSRYAQGILHDLACCIAVILNQPMPPFYYMHGVKLNHKYSMYAESFEFQCFKNGGVHVWIHPSIAIELNLWLAKKYPMAIPAEFRTKSKEIKEFEYNYDPLTQDDANYIEQVAQKRAFNYDGSSKPEARARFAKYVGMSVAEVEQLAGYRGLGDFGQLCEFLLMNGYPNIKDHQYYPTPEPIRQAIADYLGEDRRLSPDSRKLEPSAGSGRLAALFPLNLTAVEISPFFCKVLQARKIGEVVNQNFLKFKPEHDFDLIVMNPPYSKKQLEEHLKHALSMLDPEGELLLVAPAGKAQTIQEIASGRKLNMIQQFDDVFEDTRIATSLFSIS